MKIYMIWKDSNCWRYNEDFIKYLKQKVEIEHIPPTTISKEFGVDYKTIINIINKYNIKKHINKHDCNFKAIYQDYDWCYQKFIIEGLNHQEMADECGVTKRVIEKWCTEKHRLTQKYRQKNKTLNNTQRDLIIGSLMGDGHIDKRKTQPIFIVSHAINQKDYLFWKYEIVKDLCNIEPTYYESKEIKHFSSGDYICQPYYRFGTRLHDCLIPLREMSVVELLDNFNELSFSISMLDDGHRGNLWTYCIAPYTDDEKNYIIKTFKTKFNVDGLIGKDDKYMYFNAIDSKKIDRIILNNIPNNLDIIQDKIINNDNIKELCNYRMVEMNNGTKCGLAKFCKDKHIGNKKYKLLCKLFDSGIINENELLSKCKELL